MREFCAVALYIRNIFKTEFAPYLIRFPAGIMNSDERRSVFRADSISVL